MHRYDPGKAPDPELWLSLDEDERAMLIEAFHRKQRIKLPNVKAHALFHVIIENQIAEGLDCVVRAMARLQTQGLSRHDSVHAIGWVMALHVNDLMNPELVQDPSKANQRYEAVVERLSAQSWLDQVEPDVDYG